MFSWLLAFAAILAALAIGDALLQLRLLWRTRHARRAARRILQARYAGTEAGETR